MDVRELEKDSNSQNVNIYQYFKRPAFSVGLFCYNYFVMKIIFNGKILDSNCYVAKNFFQKLIGKFMRSSNVFLRQCNSIHTIFMSEPIDVIFLNDENKIIKIIECLPPRCIIFPVKNAENIIEFNAGFIKSAKINLGDILLLEE